MSVESAQTWISDQSKKPKVVIIGVPERETVRAALERLRPAIAEHAEIVAKLRKGTQGGKHNKSPAALLAAFCCWCLTAR